MSYFAVLSEDPKALEVVRCHINLWVLPGFFGRQVFYLDVGLGMKAGQTPKVALALPVGVDDDGFEDLLEKTKHNAELIFGEPTVARDCHLQFEGGDKKRNLSLSGVTAKRDAEASAQQYSVWNLTPRTWYPDSETYVRCRFRVSSMGRAWTSQRSGSLVDLRICDVRESVGNKNQSGLDARIVPIQELNLFAIIPTWLKCRAVSPAVRHLRTLEGEAWSSYLNRRPGSLKTRKLTVHYWRWKHDNPSRTIDKHNPFRAFLDLNVERAVLGKRAYLFLALTLIGVVHWNSLTEHAMEMGTSTARAVMVGTGISVATIWAFGTEVLAVLRGVPPLRKMVRKAEDRFYGS